VILTLDKTVLDFFPERYFTRFQALQSVLIDSPLSKPPIILWNLFSWVSSYISHNVACVVDTVSGCALRTALRAAFTSAVPWTLILSCFHGGNIVKPTLLHVSTKSLYVLDLFISNISHSVENWFSIWEAMQGLVETISQWSLDLFVFFFDLTLSHIFVQMILWSEPIGVSLMKSELENPWYCYSIFYDYMLIYQFCDSDQKPFKNRKT